MLNLNNEYSIELLNQNHDRERFDCGVEVLNRYIKQQAGQDLKRNLSVVFVLTSIQNKKQVIGYYSLSSVSIVLQEIPEAIQKKLPFYPNIPATLIGRLAIDQTFQRKRLGEFLLIDALVRSYKASLTVGSWAVAVDAIDEKAADL